VPTAYCPSLTRSGPAPALAMTALSLSSCGGRQATASLGLVDVCQRSDGIGPDDSGCRRCCRHVVIGPALIGGRLACSSGASNRPAPTGRGAAARSATGPPPHRPGRWGRPGRGPGPTRPAGRGPGRGLRRGSTSDADLVVAVGVLDRRGRLPHSTHTCDRTWHHRTFRRECDREVVEQTSAAGEPTVRAGIVHDRRTFPAATDVGWGRGSSCNACNNLLANSPGVVIGAVVTPLSASRARNASCRAPYPAVAARSRSLAPLLAETDRGQSVLQG
jgi:hypothetical protein